MSEPKKLKPTEKAGPSSEAPFVPNLDVDWREGKTTILSLLECALTRPSLVDIQFTFGPRQAYANKFMLKLRSPKFEDHVLKDNKLEVIILKDNPAVFRVLLKYMYTNELAVTHKNVVSLRLLAAKFAITGMEEDLSTERLLVCELNENNAVSLYQMAVALNETMHIERFLKFIVRNMTKVSMTEGFLKLKNDNLWEILEREDLDITETELYYAVVRWKLAKKPKNNILNAAKCPFKLIRGVFVVKDKNLDEKIVWQTTPLPALNKTEECRNNPDGLDLESTVIDCQNVVKYLKVAVASSDQDSVKKAFTFMEENAKMIFESTEFLELNLEYLTRLIQSDDLMVDHELEVFQAVKTWAINECERQCIDFTPKNMRLVLGNSVQHIRFGYINREEFIHHIVECCDDFLEPEELLNILTFFIYESQEHNPTSLMFPTRKRNGYKIYSANFLPDEAEKQKVQDFSSPKYSKYAYSYWFTSIKGDFDGDHFWRAFVLDQPIEIISFGFFGPSEDNATVYVELSVREMPTEVVFEQPGRLIAQQRKILKGLPKQNIFHVEFDQSVKLQADIAYVTGFCIKGCTMFSHETHTHEYEHPQDLISVELNNGSKVNLSVLNNSHSSVYVLPNKPSQKDAFFGQLPQINFLPM